MTVWAGFADNADEKAQKSKETVVKTQCFKALNSSQNQETV